MRFNDFSDETTCSAAIPHPRHGALACLRTAGHSGEHEPQMGRAAAMDGVCFECRVAGDAHDERCTRAKEADRG